MKSFDDPIILEAKRVILQEQIDKTTNLALAAIDFNKRTQEQNNVKITEENKSKPVCQENITVVNKKVTNRLKKLYFNQWKNYVKLKRKNVVEDPTIEQRKKVEKFIETLKEYKFKKGQVQFNQGNELEIKENGKSKAQPKPKPPFLRQSSLNVCSTQPKAQVAKRNVKTACEENFKNRFQAQKSIIEMQKQKLEQQEKLIEKLKYGKITTDMYKSMDSAQQSIKEIFQSASTKVKCKVSPILSVGCSEKLFELELYTHKAPKFVQEMEKRAQERAVRREMILERKRQMDEQKRKLKEQAIEAKRAQDDEETKRNLEAMKERRRKELEIEKKKQMIRLKVEQQYKLAENFHNKTLKNRYFTTWVLAVIRIHLWDERCHKKYEETLLTRSFNKWLSFYNSILEEKFYIAEYRYKKRTLERCLNVWKQEVIHSKISMQVAEDFYDMQLENKVFKHWHRYVCLQYMIQVKNTQKATQHYKRRILFQCFYQWKSLPAVMQLERAKEEKKKKWRERVWEVLPDYQPPVDV